MSTRTSLPTSEDYIAIEGSVVDETEKLVVLKAHGKRNRMSKSISVLANGQYGVANHDGRSVYLVSHARTIQVRNVLDAARALSRIADDEFIIRGALLPGLPPLFRRLLHSKQNAPATLVGVPKSYVVFDVDGVPGVLPWYSPAVSDHDTAITAVEELVKELLPRPFHGVSCWFGFTGSHGIKCGVRVRLFFCLSRPLGTQELKAWLGYLRHRGVDTSVFSPAQQVLVAPPKLGAGMMDPVRVRIGLVTGFRHVVVPPCVATLQALPNHQRATRRSTSSAAMETGYRQASSSFDRGVGGGYRATLARIGDGPSQNGIHNAIVSAVGAWVRACGPDANHTPLINDIKRQISTALIDPTKHPRAYVDEELAGLPKLIADVCGMERDRIASDAAAHKERVRAVVPSSRSLIAVTADEASQSVRVAVRAFVERLPKLLARRNGTWKLSRAENFGRKYSAMGNAVAWRVRGAAIVDVGIGKTQAVIDEVVALLGRSPEIRVAVVVPAHKLADDVLHRINRAAGREIASTWRGLSQPDPNEPIATMCRRPMDADLVHRSGGSLASICGSAARGYCSYHPKLGGPCAYIKQRGSEASIWVVPAAMLTKAVPTPMQREACTFNTGGKAHTARPPAFDLTVLDEAPFLSWLSGFDKDRVQVSLDWLDPIHFQVKQGIRQNEQDEVIEKALSGLRDMVAALFAGRDTLKEYYARECGRDTTDEFPEFERAADLLWNVLGKPSVCPEQTGEELAIHLRDWLQKAERLRSVQRLLRVHNDILNGEAAASCFEPSRMPNGTAAIRVRWREEIDASWLDNPVLYLDGTARLPLAERWLGPITPLVRAKAASPHMRVVQVDDRAFGYGTIIADSDPDTARTAAGHQKRLANLMTVARAGTGGTGLMVGPKMLVEQMNRAGLLPARWQTATYGSLRGVDAFKDVSVAVIVSRQLPPPASVELMSEVIFGRNVKRLEADWYPSVPGVRLMDDGTGRQADVECHPDPDVEMVRWTICEAEVLQGIGRPRGVRRGPSNPVLVFVLNKLDLGDIPISELITWDDLSGRCGPLMIMASQGCIPKMWADVAHMIGWWDKAADPAANARAWFRDHPAEQALLDELRKAGRINHPLTGTEMKFRRESLGMIGKNHRYVWLADGTTTDDARAILSPRPVSDPGA